MKRMYTLRALAHYKRVGHIQTVIRHANILFYVQMIEFHVKKKMYFCGRMITSPGVQIMGIYCAAHNGLQKYETFAHNTVNRQQLRSIHICQLVFHF